MEGSILTRWLPWRRAPSGAVPLPSSEDVSSGPGAQETAQEQFAEQAPGPKQAPEKIAGIGVRWVVLMLACSLLFGNFYAYDLPAALNTTLQSYLGSSDETFQYELNLLYSVYALPNMFLPLFGGGLIDRFGSSSLMQGLSVVICVGQLLFSIGIQVRSMTLMVIGRVLFGIGGESLSVAQTRMTTKYFGGRELALALGVNLSVARLGSVANDLLSPYLGHEYSIPVAVWAGLGSCVLSLLCSLTLGYIDNHAPASSTGAPAARLPPMSMLAASPVAATFHMEATGDLSDPPQDRSRGAHDGSGSFQWRAPLEFPPSFWLIMTIMVTLYGAVVPFNTIHQAFLQSKSWWYPNNPVKAAQVMGLPDFVSALLSPVVGFATDRFGFRPHTLLVCAVTISVVHTCLGYATPSLVPSPVPALVALGASYSCLLVFWPCIPIVVPEHALATAYGLATALLNACYFAFPFMAAALSSTDPTYTMTETLFAVFGVAGIMASIALWRIDKTQNHGALALPEKRRHRASDYMVLEPLKHRGSSMVLFDAPANPGDPAFKQPSEITSTPESSMHLILPLRPRAQPHSVSDT